MAKKERFPNIQTPEAVFSYPSLDQARKTDPDDPNEKAKFQLTLIFLPDAQRTPLYKAMQAQAIAAAQQQFPGKDVVAMFKAGPNGEAAELRSPFRRDTAKKGYNPPRFPEGTVFINARTTRRPQCANNKMELVVGEALREQFYAGAVGRASVSAFYYDKKGNKGVSFGLGNVQKLRDGDRIDNSSTAEDDFTADLSAAPQGVEDLFV